MKHRQWPGLTVRFLESPEGLAVLHRMLTAAHLIFVQANDCGLRNLCAFLELSGLHPDYPNQKRGQTRPGRKPPPEDRDGK